MFLNLCEGRVVKKNFSMAKPLGLKLARRKDKDATTVTQRQVTCYKSGRSSSRSRGASRERDTGRQGVGLMGAVKD